MDGIKQEYTKEVFSFKLEEVRRDIGIVKVMPGGEGLLTRTAETEVCASLISTPMHANPPLLQILEAALTLEEWRRELKACLHVIKTTTDVMDMTPAGPECASESLDTLGYLSAS